GEDLRSGTGPQRNGDRFLSAHSFRHPELVSGPNRQPGLEPSGKLSGGCKPRSHRGARWAPWPRNPRQWRNGSRNRFGMTVGRGCQSSGMTLEEEIVRAGSLALPLPHHPLALGDTEQLEDRGQVASVDPSV